MEFYTNINSMAVTAITYRFQVAITSDTVDYLEILLIGDILVILISQSRICKDLAMAKHCFYRSKIEIKIETFFLICKEYASKIPWMFHYAIILSIVNDTYFSKNFTSDGGLDCPVMYICTLSFSF